MVTIPSAAVLMGFTARAARFVESQELVMPADATYRAPCTLELTSRPVGRNTVGVVSWLMLLRTPECPDGRQVSLAITPHSCIHVPEGP